MEIVRVFTDQIGNFGNPVGVIVDEEAKINKKDRQKLAFNSGFSEIVFIEDIKSARVSIYNPIREVKFAGHALLGTIKILSDLSKSEIHKIICPCGEIKTRVKNSIYYLEATISMLPDWNLKQYDNPESIDNIKKSQAKKMNHTYCWAFLDKSKNLIRARTFAPDWGILEDQANGSGTMKLANFLNSEIQVTHGLGSKIYAKPINSLDVELGGRVDY